MKSAQAKQCPNELVLFQFWPTYVLKLNSSSIHAQHFPHLTQSPWASKFASLKQNSHTSALWNFVVDSGLLWATPNPRRKTGIFYFLDEEGNISQVLQTGNWKLHNWLSQLAKGLYSNLWESVQAQITWNCLGELWLLYKLEPLPELFNLPETPALGNWDTIMNKLECVLCKAVPTCSQTVGEQLFRIHMSIELVQAWILSAFLK